MCDRVCKHALLPMYCSYPCHIDSTHIPAMCYWLTVLKVLLTYYAVLLWNSTLFHICTHACCVVGFLMLSECRLEWCWLLHLNHSNCPKLQVQVTRPLVNTHWQQSCPFTCASHTTHSAPLHMPCQTCHLFCCSTLPWCYWDSPPPALMCKVHSATWAPPSSTIIWLHFRVWTNGSVCCVLLPTLLLDIGLMSLRRWVGGIPPFLHSFQASIWAPSLGFMLIQC